MKLREKLPSLGECKPSEFCTIAVSVCIDSYIWHNPLALVDARVWCAVCWLLVASILASVLDDRAEGFRKKIVVIGDL